MLQKFTNVLGVEHVSFPIENVTVEVNTSPIVHFDLIKIKLDKSVATAFPAYDAKHPDGPLSEIIIQIHTQKDYGIGWCRAVLGIEPTVAQSHN